MNKFFFTLSWRFIQSISSHHTLYRMTRWCFLSIALSTGALALIIAIAHGIEQTTLQKLKGLSPDIIITAHHAHLEYPTLHNVLTQEFSEEIQQISPAAVRHVIMQNPDHPHDISAPTALIIVDPQTVFSIIKPPLTRLCHEHPHNLKNLDKNSIIVGESLAHQLNLHCGDTILIRYPAEQSLRGNSLLLDTISLKIGGIFATGLSEWDAQIAFISFDAAEEIFDQKSLIDQVYLTLKPHVVSSEIQTKLTQRLGLSVVSWEDLNPSLLAAMKLERIALLLIISLITIMTAMSIMSLLSIFVLHHQRTIALLQSCGITIAATLRIFMISGMMITWSATAVGLSIASIMSYYIDHYKLISLPNIYYSSHLPAHMTGTIVGAVVLLTSLVGFFAIWYSTRRFLPTSIVELLMR